MSWKVLIAHADGEEDLAEELADPLRKAGYDVAHRGTVLVGESIVEEASKVLNLGGPLVLCGTVKAVGTKWGRRLVNAARNHDGVRIYAVQMDEDADVEALTFDEKIALYWKDRSKAITELLVSLSQYYPLDEDKAKLQICNNAEQRYRELLLETCDIVNLGNLPEDRRLAQRELKLRLLYIPLRVWVDAKAGKENVEMLWEEIEKRRARATSLRWVSRIEDVGSDRKRAPVGERLAKARRLVVLGDPGSGKTTLTRWLATSFLLRLKKDPDWRNLPDVKTIPDLDYLPIIIRCRDLDQKCLGGALDDLLHNTLRKNQLANHESDALTSSLIERLKKGTSLLILDGLDEINDPVVRTCFCQQLEQIQIAYPIAPMIVTSRIVGYREMGYRMGRGFEHVTLADLTRDEKDDFARRWCDLIELPERRIEAAEELIHDIHSSDRIERMTGNPMLLTTMALVKRKVGKLPSRRADLYWEAVQVLLNWRSDVDESLDSREAIPQLEYIAYAMCDRGVQQLRRDEVLELINNMRNEHPNLYEVRNHSPDEFLHILEARTALLIETGRIRYLGMDTPVYEFRHLTFQEYLAARALVDGCFPGRDLKRSLAEQVATLAGRTKESLFSEMGTKEVAVTESWRETLRLCTSICYNDDVDSVIEAILTPLQDEPEDTLRARAIMAALCVADEPNVSEKTVRKVFQVFSRQVNDDDGSDFRIRTGADAVAVEIARTRWARLLKDSLIEELLQRDGNNRTSLALLCGTIGAENAPEDPVRFKEWQQNLIARIRHGTEPEVIEIGSIFLKMEPGWNIYDFSGFSDVFLSRLGESPNIDLVVAALIRGSSDFSRVSWRLDSRQIACIINYVNNPKSDPVAIRDLCVFLGNHRFAVPIEPFLARLDDSASYVRSAAIWMLSKIAGNRVADLLIFLLKDSEAEVRSAAAMALGEIGSDRPVEPLIALLSDSDAEVRNAAAKALGEIGSDRVVEPLIDMLGDSNAKVRSAAAKALGEIGSDRVVEPLIDMLGDSDAKVRRAAAGALGEIGSDQAVEPLISLLGDSEADVRSSVAGTLGLMGSDQAVELLISLLSDPEADVRSSAANALGLIGSDRANEQLISRLNDSDADMRSSAANALGEIGSDRAVEPLIALLSDSEAEVRSTAANALGEIGSDRAVEPLIALLSDSEAEVRSSVASALGWIGSDQAVEPLIDILSDPSEVVRIDAAYALGWIGSDRAVEPLIALLVDSAGIMKYFVILALGEIGSDRAVEPLIALLNDSDSIVRRGAARALGKIGSIGGYRVIELLISLLEDSDGSVQDAATEALGRIGGDHATEPLIARLDNIDGAVRSEAVGALSIGLDDIDRKLLSRRLDGGSEFRDPFVEISAKSAARAADKLNIDAKDAKARYEALAERFHLRLAWLAAK